IPALSTEKNQILWSRLETAKRRLLFSLASLNLTPASKETEPETGFNSPISCNLDMKSRKSEYFISCLIFS
ncbi:MAG: hypothetical protein V4805_20440, partial [Pseudomonadota bacterium]